MPLAELIDTHAHLADPQLFQDIEDVLGRARDVGVTRIITIATNLPDSHRSVAMASTQIGLSCSVGIHPNECGEASLDHWDEIERLAQSPHVVALGETGLDRYWKAAPLELQKEWLRRHIDLSKRIGKPIVVHMRDCESELIEFLEQQAGSTSVQGVMHSYTGSLDGAMRCLELGMFISFAGMATFKNAAAIREVARHIPANRILVETDAPYLTPHPHRGKRPNEPAMVVHTAQCLAQVRNEAFEDFARQTTENAQRLFKFPAPGRAPDAP